MIKLSDRQQKIIGILLEKGGGQSSDLYKKLLETGQKISLVTVKRALAEMFKNGFLKATGSGRATEYAVSALGRMFADIDAKKYCALDPDKRYGLNYFNFELLPAVPPEIFTTGESTELNFATTEYQKRTLNLPMAIAKKELERLIIEFSWKSSKIEGNTYTLLDTEKLILENKEAVGHDHKEARMILNHKDAFNFIHENPEFFKVINQTNLEKLHAILVKDLSIGLSFRQKPVGVLGSKYRPLDNIYQIKETIGQLSASVTRMNTPHAKALLALLGISYIQPFEDGNKRTSRLMANALLMSYGLAPLSYRSVEEKDYREAMLVFYEINSFLPFKQIFVSQYNFAAKNYVVN